MSLFDWNAAKRETQHFKIIMATLQERFDAIEAKLDEGSSELLAELKTLRDQLAGSVLTPEAEATLQRIEAKSKGIADIIPGP